MRLKNAFVFVLFTLTLAGFNIARIGTAAELNQPFPSYGSGLVEVRIYTNFFCLPCRAMEPYVEPILKELLKKNAIRLTLVDTPSGERAILFARNFLYAIRENNDPEHAFRVRKILAEAANNENMTTQERIEGLFKEKGIPFFVYDVKPLFDRYNALLKEDMITGTPKCVIVMNGEKQWISGAQHIVKALNALPHGP
jgi:hypothetical protein